jgi:3-oxoacyl-[acyl-carrier protein] reductase
MTETETPHRALVTGASRGIGAAIAEELARAGHHVFVNYSKDAAGAERTVSAIESGGGSAVAVCFDVRNAGEVDAALSDIQSEENPITILVNNAGIVRDAPFPAIEPDDWGDVIDTTLRGFYNVTRPLVMPMVRTRFGRIVNIASVSGVIGNRGQVNYSAAKAGLIGATRSLSKELAKRKVTVNAVAPGLIDTEMLDGAPIDEMLTHIPMRRLGKSEEVAQLVGFLASSKAAYITGQVIGINGGLA